MKRIFKVEGKKVEQKQQTMFNPYPVKREVFTTLSFKFREIGTENEDFFYLTDVNPNKHPELQNLQENDYVIFDDAENKFTSIYAKELSNSSWLTTLEQNDFDTFFAEIKEYHAKHASEIIRISRNVEMRIDESGMSQTNEYYFITFGNWITERFDKNSDPRVAFMKNGDIWTPLNPAQILHIE